MPVLPKFDPSRSFVASRVFRYDGQIYERHAPFPLEGVDVPERKLRQLFENRFVGYDEDKADQVRPLQTRPPRERAQRERTADTQRRGEADDVRPVPSEEAKALAKKHNHEKLFAKASGLAGVKKDWTKAQIAQALIDSGRAADGIA